MEQRRLRLGDILDDYCPRERRVTNHAIVAMIEDDIKQTRCTTCDAEHPYKGGKAPRRRKKETPTALYQEVLAGMPEADAAPLLAAPAPGSAPVPAPVTETASAHAIEPEPEAGGEEVDEAEHYAAEPDDEGERDEGRIEAESPEDPGRSPAEEGPVHRPLIRATLPRPEGQKDARQPPEFTIRQSAGRNNSNFRGGDGRTKMRSGGHGAQGANGNRTHGGPRFAGARPGQGGRGQASRGAGGFRSPQQPRHGGGKKRSR